jgi:cysteine synthase A
MRIIFLVDYEFDCIFTIMRITAAEAFSMRQSLAVEEGILAGISSGASVCAALRVAEKLGIGKIVVTIVHDTGERYLSMSA